MRRYESVVLDADSTLAGIEGIDWLAARRGPEVQREVEALTAAAMRGERSLESVYARRLALIAPTAEDIRALADAYQAAVAPGAGRALAQLHAFGVSVRVVSGGLRPALLPLTRALGLADACVLAVEPLADAQGRFVSAAPSPLTTQSGKAEVVAALTLRRPILAVGDGATDLAMIPVVDAFAAFVGFVRRETVVAGAAIVFDSFAALADHVLAK